MASGLLRHPSLVDHVQLSTSRCFSFSLVRRKATTLGILLSSKNQLLEIPILLCILLLTGDQLNFLVLFQRTLYLGYNNSSVVFTEIKPKSAIKFRPVSKMSLHMSMTSW